MYKILEFMLEFFIYFPNIKQQFQARNEGILKTYSKYGRVIFFIKEGYLVTNSFHSFGSIRPSPFRSASWIVCSLARKISYLNNDNIIGICEINWTIRFFLTLHTIASMASFGSVNFDSWRIANTMSFSYMKIEQRSMKILKFWVPRTCDMNRMIIEIVRVCWSPTLVGNLTYGLLYRLDNSPLMS